MKREGKKILKTSRLFEFHEFSVQLCIILENQMPIIPSLIKSMVIGLRNLYMISFLSNYLYFKFSRDDKPLTFLKILFYSSYTCRPYMILRHYDSHQVTDLAYALTLVIVLINTAYYFIQFRLYNWHKKQKKLLNLSEYLMNQSLLGACISNIIAVSG